MAPPQYTPMNVPPQMQWQQPGTTQSTPPAPQQQAHPTQQPPTAPLTSNSAPQRSSGGYTLPPTNVAPQGYTPHMYSTMGGPPPQYGMTPMGVVRYGTVLQPQPPTGQTGQGGGMSTLQVAAQRGRERKALVITVRDGFVVFLCVFGDRIWNFQLINVLFWNVG